MGQNVSKKEIIVVPGEEEGRSFPRWFGQIFLGRKKNRSSQENEQNFSVDISELGSSSDPLAYDDRCHPELDLSSVTFAEEGGLEAKTEQSSDSCSDAKKKQQQLLEEFALLSGIELSSQSVADLRDSVEKQVEEKSLSPASLLESEPESSSVVDHSENTETEKDDSVLEKQPSGRVHDAYTLLIENEKKQQSVQPEHVDSAELEERPEESKASTVVIEHEEPVSEFDSSAIKEVIPDGVMEVEVVAEVDDHLDEDLNSKLAYDQEAMDAVLSELNKINAINSAVVVDNDGAILACNAPDKLNETIFGTLIPKSIKHFQRMGQQSGLGSLAQSVIEFEEGKLVVENLGESALFIVVDRSAILGIIRKQTKVQVENLKLILS